jgi:hypothetical protein
MNPTEQHFCAINCRQVTTWSVGSKQAKCQGCRTLFPCAACGHIDCREARGEVSCCTECKVIDGHLASCSQKKPVDVQPEPVTINP